MAASPTDADIYRRAQRLPHEQSLAGTRSAAEGQNGSLTRSSTAHSDAQPKPAGPATHQRFVLTDPVAFRYLEQDRSTTVLDRRTKLEGYDCYIVEQWACSRSHPTFVITTYTGDPNNTVMVGVLSIPTSEAEWSPQLKIYFKALDQYHARRRETPLGILMVTNLSSFPSSLTVIPVPEGDVKKHREHFIVNEDLKRLGCSGRVGLQLTVPSSATQAKFHQLYRTSDKIPIFGAVIELVKLCQGALVLFGKLKSEYADGLLCDITEKAINDWWVEFGTDYYNIEPNDGILGPTTVAALLGMAHGARNRLSAYGAPVSKDVFDLESTKRGIAYFQRSQRMPKTRRLDRSTLERLRKVTAKAASNEGWTMPRAVKSTVAELSGKGGEMVMDMVGAKDKAGIAEIETVDLDRFVELVHGERSKWLWYGKPRKNASGDMFSRLPGNDELIFSKDEQGNFSWSTGKRGTLYTEDVSKEPDAADSDARDFAPDGLERTDKDLRGRRGALKRAITRNNEARSGFGRIKDAVGRRHEGKHSRDEHGQVYLNRTGTESSSAAYGKPENFSGSSGIASPPSQSAPAFTQILTETPSTSNQALFPDPSRERTRSPAHGTFSPLEPISTAETLALSKTSTAEDSIAGSIYHGFDLRQILPADELYTKDIGPCLRRTQSFSEGFSDTFPLPNPPDDNRWPRSLSFSITEPSVLTWTPIGADPEPAAPATDPTKALAQEQRLADAARRTRERLALLGAVEGAWVDANIAAVERLAAQADRDQEQLEDLYAPRLEGYRALRQEAGAALDRAKAGLADALRDLDALAAKLEYELNALAVKVDDVEDGVEEFATQVRATELRVREMEDVLGDPDEGWCGWVCKKLGWWGKGGGSGGADRDCDRVKEGVEDAETET